MKRLAINILAISSLLTSMTVFSAPSSGDAGGYSNIVLTNTGENDLFASADVWQDANDENSYIGFFLGYALNSSYSYGNFVRSYYETFTMTDGHVVAEFDYNFDGGRLGYGVAFDGINTVKDPSFIICSCNTGDSEITKDCDVFVLEKSNSSYQTICTSSVKSTKSMKGVSKKTSGKKSSGKKSSGKKSSGKKYESIKQLAIKPSYIPKE